MKGLLRKLFRKPSENCYNPYEQVSFSQCGEDLIIQYVFKLRGIEVPSYLDIGAHHPFYLSNTALFNRKGGKGVNIEANPSLLQEFRIQRPNDINLNIGIASTPGTLDFYVMSDNTLSTFSKEERDQMIDQGRECDRVEKIQLTTINQIVREHCKGIFPDLLSLDVEGFDYDILKHADFTESAPKIICVEAAEYSPIGAGARRNDMIDLVVGKGYTEYANTNLNAILVKNDFWFM